LTVEVFPANQYQLTLSIPPLGKASYTKESSTNVATGDNTTTTTTTGKTGGSESVVGTTTDSTDAETGITVTDDDIKTVPDKLQFDFKINGQSSDVSVDITKLLTILQNIQKTIVDIQQLIKNWVPQVGFKFEFSLSFFAGQIMLAWGYKENTDWQTYYGLSAKFSLTVFSISLTLSFGIQMPGLLARVEGTVTGTASLATEFDFNAPGQPIAPSVTATIDIPAKIDGRGQAGVGFLSASVEVGIKTGFNGQAGIRTAGTQMEIFATVTWAGIDAYITWSSSPNQTDQTDVTHLIDPSTIYDQKLDF
jgi:hypothetical protein